MDKKPYPHTELGFSPDALVERKAELLALLKQVAPEIVSDNQIDMERFKTLLGEDGIAPAEHYELTWAGKSAARAEIQKSTSHTLLPSAGNPSSAPHMLIEGENLEVLRVLQKSYHNKVKMIYIDPPYNTGSDSFVYPDDYSETLDEYQRRTGEKSEDGYLNKQSLWKKNSKESGQYHSAWLSMMYPRLYLARNLLRDDGVIFISIDDHEAANLKLLCDEVFGEDGFAGVIVWQRSKKGDSKLISKVHEYILCYVKNKAVAIEKGAWRLPKKGASEVLIKYSELRKEFNDDHGKIREKMQAWFKGLASSDPRKAHKHYNYSDDRGLYFAADFAGPDDGRASRPRHDILHPITGKVCKKPSTGWRWDQDKTNWALAQTPPRIHFGVDDNTIPNRKSYLFEIDSEPYSSVFYQDGRSATLEVEGLVGKGCFPFPKNVNVLTDLVKLVTNKDDIVLDFFAGSGSTAQAVMELNLKDDGRRQVICVQMPELLDSDSDACKVGYNTIADITFTRINKVIAKLKAENPDKTAELACAHFSLAPSNFKVWNGVISDTTALRNQLQQFQQAEKPQPDLFEVDTSTAQISSVERQRAMLAELLLKHGMGALGVQAVSEPVVVAGVTIHSVLMADDQVMWICFEPYNAALKDEIVKAKPAKVLLLNSCFVGNKADELIANLQLELAGLDIDLTVI